MPYTVKLCEACPYAPETLGKHYDAQSLVFCCIACAIPAAINREPAVRPPWTPQERDALRLLFFAGKTDIEVGTELDRSDNAVRCMRYLLRLYRRDPERCAA